MQPITTTSDSTDDSITRQRLILYHSHIHTISIYSTLVKKGSNLSNSPVSALLSIKVNPYIRLIMLTLILHTTCYISLAASQVVNDNFSHMAYKFST